MRRWRVLQWVTAMFAAAAMAGCTTVNVTPATHSPSQPAPTLTASATSTLAAATPGPSASYYADASCTANRIDRAAAMNLLTRFQVAVKKGDRAAVESMVAYPHRWNVPHLVVRDRAEFAAKYSALFTPTVISAITQADPGTTFCTPQGFSIGDGVVWGNVTNSGAYEIFALNA